MLFKIYQNDTALFFSSIKELADFCEVSLAEARTAYYKGTARLGGHEVINYSKK
jgi:hypothetical protein